MSSNEKPPVNEKPIEDASGTKPQTEGDKPKEGQGTNKKENTKSSLSNGYKMNYQKKLAGAATKVIINANRDNDYGFDISPDNNFSPYRGKDCAKDLENDLDKLKCASEKFKSRVGMQMHQRARKNKYRGLITDICKKDKQLACSKYALPVHDICSCDMKSMNLTDIVPYAMSFYRGLGELIESNTMSKDDYRELARKAAVKLDKVSDTMNKGVQNISKVKEGAKFIGKGLAGDAKFVGKGVVGSAKKIASGLSSISNKKKEVVDTDNKLSI